MRLWKKKTQKRRTACARGTEMIQSVGGSISTVFATATVNTTAVDGWIEMDCGKAIAGQVTTVVLSQTGRRRGSEEHKHSLANTAPSVNSHFYPIILLAKNSTILTTVLTTCEASERRLETQTVDELNLALEWQSMIQDEVHIPFVQQRSKELFMESEQSLY